MTRKIMKAIFVKHSVCALLALFGVSVLKAAEIIVPEPFSDICGSGSNAVVCAVGDTVVLPTLGEGEYTINNTRVASISGNTVTALEPGFTGVVNPSSAVGGIVVLPAVGGAGRVFVANIDTTDTLKNNFSHVFQWCNAENWTCVYGNGENDYPNGTDDVAMIPFAIQNDYATYDQGGYIVKLVGAGDDAEVVLGQLFMGTFAACKMNCHLTGGHTSGTIRFRRSDGVVPRFAFTGGSAATGESWLRTKADSSTPSVSAPSFDLSQGLTVDLGYTGAGSPTPHVFFIAGSLNLPEGRRLVFENGRPGYAASENTDSGIQFEKDFALGGTGTIRNDSDMNMRVDSEGDAIFAGLWESGGVHPSESYGGLYGGGGAGAGIDFRKATAEGRTVLSDGGIKQRILTSGYCYFQDYGCRGIKIGNSGTGTGLDFYPERIRSVGHVILNSGLFGVSPGAGGNGNADIITTRVDRLTFGFGLSKLNFYGAQTSETTMASNFVQVVSVEQDNLAQVDLFMSDIFYDDATTGSSLNRMLKVKFDDFGNHAIGGIIPWMAGVSRKRGGLCPPMVDENGFIYYDMPAEVTMANATADAPFVRVTTHPLTADKTVNAIRMGSMRNKSSSEYGFGAGRTLTVASGAVFLGEYSFVGNSATPESNGTLAFGAPGYVYSTVSATSDRIPQLNAAMAAPQGVAFAGLADCGVVLTGDKTGIEKELVVNGTTVILGSATAAANLDVDIRVAGGFSVLDVQNVNSHFLKRHTLTLQDSGNYPAKVNLAPGTYPVEQLIVAGKKMLSGTYGSTASGADNVDDDHFSGEGSIMVASGAGLKIIIR